MGMGIVKGFMTGDEMNCIERVAKNSMELSLLAKGDGTEIMFYRIKQGHLITADPNDNNEAMEFFYIIDGSLDFESDGERVVVNKGEYFYMHRLTETVYLKALSDITLLYVSTQPVFHCLSNEVMELNNILKKAQQKDIYTYNHNIRVKEYASKIAERLHLSRERLENLVHASYFHDIGKINVPDEILNKPGCLNEEEFDCIKKHSEDGFNIINVTHLKDSGKIIEQHHERLDGSGYPRGLKGEEIMLEARIIAVADSYDAMTSDRAYRKGMEPFKAISELKSMIGTHYDEKVISTFEQILNEEYGLII
jgi:putative nucleotidyltransferase with HDIG domain